LIVASSAESRASRSDTSRRSSGSRRINTADRRLSPVADLAGGNAGHLLTRRDILRDRRLGRHDGSFSQRDVPDRAGLSSHDHAVFKRRTS
jgi:hypothetical protein